MAFGTDRFVAAAPRNDKDDWSILNYVPPEGRKWDSKGANAAAAQLAKSGEESPMRQGVFENTDFKNDYAELRNNVPLARESEGQNAHQPLSYSSGFNFL